MNWYLGYYPNDQRARLDLLLDGGADFNSTMPQSESDSVPYCSIARKWGLTTATRTRMHCICSNAAPIRTESLSME
jgi:hypothetical protein